MDFMQSSFRPQYTYWRADDGRIYSGPKQMLVDETDADYLAYAAAQPVRQWPRDIAGNQTTEALQDVLTPFGMFADLLSYAADRRWRKEVGGTTLNGVAYPTDRDTQGKLASAFLLAGSDSTTTFKWKLPDGTFTPTIDAATMQALAKAVGQFVNGCFLIEEAVVTAINDGTITTREQVDAAFEA